MDIKKYNF